MFRQALLRSAETEGGLGSQPEHSAHPCGGAVSIPSGRSAAGTQKIPQCQRCVHACVRMYYLTGICQCLRPLAPITGLSKSLPVHRKLGEIIVSNCKLLFLHFLASPLSKYSFSPVSLPHSCVLSSVAPLCVSFVFSRKVLETFCI